MKKMMKKTVTVLLAGCMGASVAACGGGNQGGNGDDKICEVKAVISGYSTDWLVEAVSVFNNTYKSEGYEVQISLMDTEVGMAMEMTTPRRNTTDLYFDYLGEIKPMIEKSRSVLGSDGGALLEDLSDVLASKAVGKDKKEQGGAISERIHPTDIELCKYNGTFMGFDGTYALPWYGGSAGVYVNAKVLEQKGYSLDGFLTTDSILEMTAALAPEDRLNKNEFFPVTWTGTSAGYWSYWIETLMAQYMGVETYEDFWNYIPNGDESKVIEEGYKVYENRGIYEALKVAENLMNTDYAVPGTASMDHISAQARLLEGSSLFMVSGDWIYKEMELNYGKYLNDIVAIKNPVLSAVGVKLGLCGQTHAEPTFDRNNFVDTYACEDCEAKLRATIKAVDSGKSDAEVATEVGITATQAAEVRERRGYYQSCNGFAAMIPSYSNAKDVAKLFLRFLCSDDGIAIYNKNTHSNFIVKPVNEPDTTAMSAREKSLYDKIYGKDSTAIFNRSENPIRVVTSSSIFPAAGTTKLAYTQISYSHIDNKNPTYTAKTTYFDNVLVAQGNWGDWLAAAGLI